jgi:DNA polymerase (family 10)
MITNVAISKILRQIAYLIELQKEEDKVNKDKANAVLFKTRAYRRAADIIENLPSNVEEIYNEEKLKGLSEIPSVGKSIAIKIEEYITTGKVEYLEELKEKTTIDIEEFYNLEGIGIGPRTIKALHDSLRVNNLSDLEKAASEGKIHNIPGFSYKKEQSILKKIQSLKKERSRYLLGNIYPLVKEIEVRLSNVKGVKKAIAVGSFRRMKETVGDIDYLVLSDAPGIVMDYFASMPEVDEVIGKGPSKTFVKLNNGMDADLLAVPEESFGSALQYFTGSKEHSVVLRKIAISKDLRLNEWGVYDKKNKMVAGSTEEGVYHVLDLEWIPPEMRENNGEIELAVAKKEKEKEMKKDKLPKLIQYDGLKGDLHVHSNSSDGTMSIQDMALAAKEKFGLEYIAITDHTKNSLSESIHGIDEKQLLDQISRIKEINDKIRKQQQGYDSSFQILSSAEVNIMKDSSLDISDNVLDKLDIVGAAINSDFEESVEVQTGRLIAAAQNPNIDIIFHPTGRRINKNGQEEGGYPVNIEKLIEVAKNTNTILEVNAYYNRLDLKDDYIRMAVQSNVKLVINSDSHKPNDFEFLKFGIGQARRGWAKKSDILNTLPADKLLKNIK